MPAALGLALFAGPATSAFADTNPPSIDSNSVQLCSGAGSCTLTVPVAASGENMAVYVSSDGPSNKAQTITVKEGTSNWGTQATSTSYASPQLDPGYTGVFTKASVTSGTHTLVVKEGTNVGKVWAVAMAYTGSGGFTSAASATTDTGNPTVALTTNGANEAVFCVSHDWTQDLGVTGGATGYGVYASFDDSTNGDAAGLYRLLGNSSGAGVTNCGHGSPDWTGDDTNVSGIVVLGT